MKIYAKLTDITREYKWVSVALGMFDGVHVGHQSIIRRAADLAKAHGGVCAVFTFANHPLSILAPDRMPLQIATPELRAHILAELGVDILFSVPFTKEFSKIAPERFLAILRDNMAPRYVVTGANFTFGKDGKGNQRLLLRLAESYNFTAEICPTVLSGGRAVSSTRVRSLIKSGDLLTVNEFLGRPFTFAGRVIHGDRRGRALGFPTANLAIAETQAMLPNGAYAAQVLTGGRLYNGLANIGNNPTFAGVKRRLEVNIQDFATDIYNELIQVRFWEKLRDEKKFSSAEQLVKQLRRDREMAEAIWARL
ncbi:MAG: bifunctional riboflavin kinase/FAD synthetase [Selenomonadaceae bacterium]|nr:bifunctional riboflavin kinase/FAD synthetase [Selenomonadaceae bacterium]